METNLTESLHKDNMFYFILGSLISSNGIESIEDVNEARKSLDVIEKSLKESSLDEQVKSEYQERIKSCYEVLDGDQKKFEEGGL